MHFTVLLYINRMLKQLKHWRESDYQGEDGDKGDENGEDWREIAGLRRRATLGNSWSLLLRIHGSDLLEKILTLFCFF